MVRQANVFIRWAGGGHWDLLMAAYNDFTAYIANGERGGVIEICLNLFPRRRCSTLDAVFALYFESLVLTLSSDLDTAVTRISHIF